MSKINEIICIGGGTSISEGISLGLKEKLEGKFCIAINYSYKHFPHTILTFSDRDFYVPAYAKLKPDKHPDIYDELKQLPLIIGLEKNNGINEFLLPNTYLIKCPKKELPTPKLTGIFALCIAEKLKPDVIYLLGYDFPRRDPKTILIGKDYNPYSSESIHYYSKEEINHRGQNWISFYENHNPDEYFFWFVNPKITIYNVSINSNINNFSKINYTEFFSLLSNQTYNQQELREYIKNKLKFP